MSFIIKLYNVNLGITLRLGIYKKLENAVCQSGVVVKLLYIVETGGAT